MKLDKYKPTPYEDRRPRPGSTRKGDKPPLMNIHGIQRHIKESPEVVKERLDISDSYRGKLDNRASRKDSIEGVLEWDEIRGRVLEKMGKKR